jgi:anti-sigma factor (TIGR02949 family)
MKIEPCIDQEKCNQVLHLVIDGEATHEEEDYFYSHILQCMDCSHYFMLEQTIRDALRNKVDKKQAPEDFISQLRMKIKKLPK